MSKRKRYAGEGMVVNKFGSTVFTRPLAFIHRMFLRLIGRKPKDSLTLTRDFYAAITSDHGYVILGEQRYGISSRIASIEKPKPNPPRKRNA